MSSSSTGTPKLLLPTHNGHQSPHSKSPIRPGWSMLASLGPLCTAVAVLAARLFRRGATPSGLALLAVSSEPADWLAPVVPNGPAADQFAAARTSALEAARALGFPQPRAEEWRFTDLAGLRRAQCEAARPVTADVALPPHPLAAADGTRVVVINGHLHSADLALLHPSVYIGPLQGSPVTLQAATYEPLTQSAASFFGHLNMALCPTVLCIAVPDGVAVERPIHVVYGHAAGEGGAGCPLAAPRLVVVLGRDARAALVEEFLPVDGAEGQYASIPVLEVKLAEGAELSHTVLQQHGEAAAHLKTTVVRQAARSAYREVEVNVGARLARHDVRVEQLGPATETELQCFSLAGPGQCHDLHSRVLLDHPNATVNQLHKQIAAHPSARGVFDGNVRVGKQAQKTDAGQLTRSLLLRRGATVNVKPNLQIIADDVKCSHGCAVADLDAAQIPPCQPRAQSYVHLCGRQF
eukprot:EG_transcript_6034